MSLSLVGEGQRAKRAGRGKDSSRSYSPLPPRLRAAPSPTRGEGKNSPRPLLQPLVDRRRYFLLRASGDVDADVAAAEREFGIILAADEILQRFRRRRRYQVVLFGVDVEHRHLDQAEVHFAIADDDTAVDETVALVELLDELAERLSGLVGRIEDPLFHAQEILDRRLVVEDVDQTDVLLHEQPPRLQREVAQI